MKQYPSKYSNGKNVSAAQFITEIICERIAQKQRKDLHFRFWLSKDWEKEYKGQIATAHKLLQTYDDRAIIKALQSDKGKKIYSLRAPHLKDIIDIYQKQVELEIANTSNNKKKIDRNLLNKGIDNKSYNILDKIKDIDNGFTR